MATFNSALISNSKGRPNQEPVRVGMIGVSDGTVAVTTALDAADLIRGAILPAGCVLTDLKVSASDLDTNGTPTLVTNFGVFNSAGTALEDTLIASSTLGQAAGVDTADGYYAIETYAEDRYVGGVVGTAAATAAAGNVRVTIQFRQATIGE